MSGDARQARTPRPVRKLSKRLDVARQLHALEQDSALTIVDIERLRVSVTRWLWVFLAIGSVFTTTGVQDFLAGHLTPTDPVWWGCWGVEPCMVGVLITILRWEAAMIVLGVDIVARVVAWLKRFLLACTLIMNVVPALWPREGGISAGMLAAHIMVPVLVFFLAEVMPIVQSTCTQARRAVTLATPPTPTPTAPVQPPASPMVPAPAVVPPAPPVVTPSATADDPAVPPAREALTPAPVSPAQARPASASADPTPVIPPAQVRIAPTTPAPAPTVDLEGLGIPAGMQQQIRQLLADSPAGLTAADIQRATRLPLPIAARVLDRLSPVSVNGYAH